MIAQNFNPTAEFTIPTGTTINEANEEVGAQPLTAEMEMWKI